MRVIRSCKNEEIGKTDKSYMLLVIFDLFRTFPFGVILSEYKIKKFPLWASYLQIARNAYIPFNGKRNRYFYASFFIVFLQMICSQWKFFDFVFADYSKRSWNVRNKLKITSNTRDIYILLYKNSHSFLCFCNCLTRKFTDSTIAN